MKRRSVIPFVVALLGALVTLFSWYSFERGATVEQSRLLVVLLTGVFLGLITPAVIGMWRRPTDVAPRLLALAAFAFTIGYFRFLQTPWVASLGAFVWYASPVLLLATFTESSAPNAAARSWRWTALAMVVAVAAILTSAPRNATAVDDSLRASSWSYWDDGLQLWLRQPNALAVWPNEFAVYAVWLAWSTLIGAFTWAQSRRIDRPWPWHIGLVVGAAATILLALPQRLNSSWFLVAQSYGDLLTAIPAIAVAAFAAWMVWGELITPRLSRPSDHVLQLDAHSTIDGLRQHVIHTVADPSVAIVFPRDTGWVDDEGRVHVDHQRPGRTLCIITRDALPVAALDLDATAAQHTDLVQLAAMSLAVSLDAQRLAALSAAAADDTRAAASRLLTVEQDAQREIRERIAEGPDLTLARLTERLDERPLPLVDIHQGLRIALEQVRSIAHGVTSIEDRLLPGPARED